MIEVEPRATPISTTQNDTPARTNPEIRLRFISTSLWHRGDHSSRHDKHRRITDVSADA